MEDYFSKADYERIDKLKEDGYEIYQFGFGVPSSNKNSLYYKIEQAIIAEGLEYKVVYGRQYFKAYNYVFLTRKGLTNEKNN